MMLARFGRAAALIATLVVVYAPAAGAQANEWTELCRFADEVGALDEMGATRGECLNTVRGSANENARNFAAGLCGSEVIQREVGARNKGQCIQIVSEFPDGEA